MSSVRFGTGIARFAVVAIFALGPLLAPIGLLAPAGKVDMGTVWTIAAIGGVVAVVASRVPVRAWWLIAAFAFAPVLIGVGIHSSDDPSGVAVLVVPLVVAAVLLEVRAAAPALLAWIGVVAVTLGLASDRTVATIAVLAGSQVVLAALGGAAAWSMARRLRAERLRAAVAGASDPAAIGAAIVEHCLTPSVTAAMVLVVDESPPTLGRVLVDVGSVGAPLATAFRIGRDDVLARVALGGPVTVSADGSEDGHAAALLRGRGLAAGAIVPLRSVGELVGILLLGSTRAGAFRRGRLARLVAESAPLADALGVYVLRHQALDRSRLVLEGRAVSQAISAARTVDALFDAVLAGLAAMLGFDRGWIAQRDPAEPEVIVSAAGLGIENVAALRIDTRRELSIAQEAMVRGEPTWVPDVQRSPTVNRRVARDLSAEAALLLPLVDAGETRGVVIGGFTAPRMLRSDEIDVAASLANEAAMAWARLDAEDRLRVQATRDPLTGLLNHAAFHAAVATALRQSDGREPVALVLSDLDHLKFLNDSFGHRAGDDALRAVGAALGSCARRGDVLGRLGGDEFGWLLPGASPDDALAAAQRAVGLVAATAFEGIGQLSLSAGVAVALAASDAEPLFERADLALYEAKARGRGVAVAGRGDGRRRARGERVLDDEDPEVALAGTTVGEACRLASIEWSAVFRASACAISLLEDDALRDVAYASDLRQAPGDGRAYPLSHYPSTARAMADRRPLCVRVGEPDADPAELAILRENGMQSLLLIPIVAGDSVLGTVELYDTRPRVFSADEQRLALALGRYLGATLQRLPAA